MSNEDWIPGERFSEQEAKALKRLVYYAHRKLFVAQILVNGYNCDYACVDMRCLMLYSANEPYDSTFKADIYTLLELMARNVETHLIVGEDVIHRLMKAWKGKLFKSY